jgi:hypothetical protein
MARSRHLARPAAEICRSFLVTALKMLHPLQEEYGEAARSVRIACRTERAYILAAGCSVPRS